MTPTVPDLPVKSDPTPPTQLSLAERIAILEDRTALKKRTALDRLKDWGGLLSLVIAIGYSFPLGIWEDFIKTEQDRKAEELAVLRRAVDESTAMMADGARAMAGIPDPKSRDIVGRGLATRMYVLMMKHRAAFEGRRNEFVAPELMVLGYNFLSTNQTDAALLFFEAAEERSTSDLITRIEAHRARAKVFFLNGPYQNRALARKLFAEAMVLAQQEGTLAGLNSYLTVAADWGLHELLDGDWVCGTRQVEVARAEYVRRGALLGDGGHFMHVLDQMTGPLRPREGQPRNGCPASPQHAGALR
jgi:hypothetical protein